ncbi:MAG TPA: tetratricopeptide repeat protein [Phycisphaerae bacterium]|nr:tetratricopeptide repeat protein [Phycisphaerae bacterium]HQE42762.1 tetratricopeptide repeat protein [Phycisphaerae bacterium]
MPAAPGGINTLFIGLMITGCALVALGADGASPPREGAVYQGMRFLYDIPKAPNGATAASPSQEPAAGSDYPSAGRKPYTPPKYIPRYSRDLAAPSRSRTAATAQSVRGTANGQMKSSNGPGDVDAPIRDDDRAYTSPSYSGYRGWGRYGYGRRAYYDYRRSLRWPVATYEWNDPRYGPGRADVYAYGDTFESGGGYGPVGGFGYAPGGGIPADAPYRDATSRWGGDHAYFDETSNARTGSLLQSALTSRDRGLAHFHKGQYREAADAFRLACDVNHGDPAARIYAGHALFATGRYREAVKYLRKAFELQPRIVYLTYDMRQDYPNRTDFDQQVAALREALRLAPRDSDRLFMLGYVYYYGGQREQAYSIFSQLVYWHPGDALARKLMEACQPPDVAVMPPARR